MSPHHILNSIDRSLKRLRTDYIDLYQVHSWDPFTPIEETLIQEIAKQKRAGEATVALAWLIARPYITSVILGAKDQNQLSENLKASGLNLTEGEIASLDEVSSRPLPYPQWMVM